MEASAQRVGEQSVATRLLFIVIFLVLGSTRPHYSAWQNAVSSLRLGEGGWMQSANFIVCGALVLGFAIGLRPALRAGRGSTWGSILLAIFGFCLVGAGTFATDPRLGYPPGASGALTVHGTLHNLLSLVVFVSLIAACFVLARRDAANPAGRGWTWYAVAIGLLVAVFFILTSVAVMLGRRAGLIQRMCIIAGWSWIERLSIRLVSSSVPLV